MSARKNPILYDKNSGPLKVAITQPDRASNKWTNNHVCNIDYCCAVLDKNGRLITSDYFVFYGQDGVSGKSPGIIMVDQVEQVTFSIDTLPDEAHKLVFLALISSETPRYLHDLRQLRIALGKTTVNVNTESSVFRGKKTEIIGVLYCSPNFVYIENPSLRLPTQDPDQNLTYLKSPGLPDQPAYLDSIPSIWENTTRATDYKSQVETTLRLPEKCKLYIQIEAEIPENVRKKLSCRVYFIGKDFVSIPPNTESAISTDSYYFRKSQTDTKLGEYLFDLAVLEKRRYKEIIICLHGEGAKVLHTLQRFTARIYDDRSTCRNFNWQQAAETSRLFNANSQTMRICTIRLENAKPLINNKTQFTPENRNKYFKSLQRSYLLNKLAKKSNEAPPKTNIEQTQSNQLTGIKKAKSKAKSNPLFDANHDPQIIQFREDVQMSSIQVLQREDDQFHKVPHTTQKMPDNQIMVETDLTYNHLVRIDFVLKR